MDNIHKGTGKTNPKQKRVNLIIMNTKNKGNREVNLNPALARFLKKKRHAIAVAQAKDPAVKVGVTKKRSNEITAEIALLKETAIGSRLSMKHHRARRNKFAAEAIEIEGTAVPLNADDVYKARRKQKMATLCDMAAKSHITAELELRDGLQLMDMIHELQKQLVSGNGTSIRR